MYRNYIRRNKLAAAIFIFVLAFLAVHTAKPSMLYTPDGGFRQFGVGYKQKTIIPIWLVAIILAIFSYLAVLYYIHW
jgi:hypothetical protein